MNAGAGFEQRRAWVREAIRRIEADYPRSSDTQLIPLPLPGFAGIDLCEVYFARLLGLPFVAVMPRGTSPQKIAAIEFHGGRCHLVADPTTLYAESPRLADELQGHCMDQLTHAERATDWRTNNNIGESIYLQMPNGRPSCAAPGGWPAT